MLKLHFEPDLDFQLQAVDGVCDLFRGQEICRTEFTVTRDRLDPQQRLAFAQDDLGVGNRLTLLDDEILANLKAIQLRNGLPPSESLDSGGFTVELETGTGKIYVYLRTIFELNKRYGFTKFVIVVPSVAIKEGVYKSLQMTDDHFRALYSGESYEEFAENLQREIEEDTGIRFGVIETHQFAQIPVTGDGGETTVLGFEKSQALYDHLQAEGYLDAKGRIQDSLREAIRDGSLALPDEFAAMRAGIASVLSKLAGRLEVKNADERQTVRPRQAVLDSAEFKALWDRIKHKTAYRVTFDTEALLEASATALRNAQPIPRTRLQWRKADIAIGQAGVEATEIAGSAPVVLEETDIELPDLLTELQDRTQLTRRSIHRVLVGSRRLDDFQRNPQQFIELAAQAINSCKQRALVDGIKYQRIGDEAYYAQELFEKEELTGYLKNVVTAEKSVHEKVIYESDTEARFADEWEKNDAVKLYAKLPGWFTVPTPLGSYNPDWAVLVDTDEGERLYFVVETKASTLLDDLRLAEYAKIECGKAHFEALQVRENPARYEVASSVDQLFAEM